MHAQALPRTCVACAAAEVLLQKLLRKLVLLSARHVVVRPPGCCCWHHTAATLCSVGSIPTPRYAATPVHSCIANLGRYMSLTPFMVAQRGRRRIKHAYGLVLQPDNQHDNSCRVISLGMYQGAALPHHLVID